VTVPGRTYAGKLPADRVQERRERLLAAGLELFGTNGYAATTNAQLCRVAGVAPGKLYEEFRGKEAVLQTLVEDVVSDVIAAVRAALSESKATRAGDILGASRAGLSAFFHSLLDDPRRAQVFLIEVVGVSRELDQGRPAVVDAFAALVLHTFWAVTEEPAHHLVPTEQERIVTRALVGGTNEAIVALLANPDPLALDQLVESLAGMYAAVGAWLSSVRHS
jgi:AcrR family transcriptional regulator